MIVRVGFRAARIFALAGFCLTSAAQAAGPDINATPTGLALRGYDPVAYFITGKAEPGDFRIISEFRGATYRFVSNENKKLFEDEPRKFVPQFGGYCAFGAAMGKKYDGDPTVFRVIEGKLYLNLAPPVQKRWEREMRQFIEKANKNWSEIADVQPDKL